MKDKHWLLTVALIALLVYVAAQFHGQQIKTIDDYMPQPRLTAENPADRVEIFIDDWYHWWSATNDSVGSPLRRMNDEAERRRMDLLDQWMKLETDVIRRNYTSETADAFRPLSYGTPAEHSPVTEAIVGVTRPADDRAIVETRSSTQGFPQWYEYIVVREDDDWRIQNVIWHLDPEGVPLLPAATTQKLLDAVSVDATSPAVASDTYQRLSRLFEPAEFDSPNGSHVVITVREIDSLELPSGCLGVCDIGDKGDMFRPLERSVPPGTYAMQLAEARMDETDLRNSAARLLLGDPSTVVSWVEAQTVEIGGYVVGVDTGNVAFFDATTFLQQERRDLTRLYNRYVNLRSDISSDTDAFVRVSFTSDRLQGNCLVVDSGWGDGGYPCYWGLDDGGSPVVLLVDFRLWELPSPAQP